MVAYRRAKYLKDKLIRAKVPPPPPKREQRKILGMKKCNKFTCETCPFVKSGNKFTNTYNNTTVNINYTLNCNSDNVIYCLICNKQGCGKIYIGKTERELKARFSEHKTSVRKKYNNVVGQHFNSPGHSLENLQVTALEKVYTLGTPYIEKRESMWIERLEAEFRGLNIRQ